MIDELLGPAGLKVVLDFCELDIAENTVKQSDLSATVHVKKKKLCSGIAAKVCDVLSVAGFLKAWHYGFHSMPSSSGWSRVWQVLQSVIQMPRIQKR